MLVICTGNVYRSPLAERLLAHALAGRGVEARVSSAGLVADGLPAAPEVVSRLAGHGLDATDHASRRLHRDHVAGADLVVGMARRHVREAVLAVPDRFDRVFTLKELVRRGRAAGPRPADEPLDGWLARAGAGRQPRDTLGDAEADDLTDPIGRPAAVFARVAAEIEDLVAALVDLAWPLRRATPPPHENLGGSRVR